MSESFEQWAKGVRKMASDEILQGMRGIKALFLVVAYRWGASNDHQYFVYLGDDETKAHALARSEVDDRGGKYDCAIYTPNDDGTAFTLCGYVAARDDQTKPEHNWLLDMFEALGHELDRYADGKVTVPDPKDENCLKWEPCEPEPRLLARVQQIRGTYEQLRKISDERNAETKS